MLIVTTVSLSRFCRPLPTAIPFCGTCLRTGVLKAAVEDKLTAASHILRHANAANYTTRGGDPGSVPSRHGMERRKKFPGGRDLAGNIELIAFSRVPGLQPIQ